MIIWDGNEEDEPTFCTWKIYRTAPKSSRRVLEDKTERGKKKRYWNWNCKVREAACRKKYLRSTKECEVPCCSAVPISLCFLSLCCTQRHRHQQSQRFTGDIKASEIGLPGNFPIFLMLDMSVAHQPLYATFTEASESTWYMIYRTFRNIIRGWIWVLLTKQEN